MASDVAYNTVRYYKIKLLGNRNFLMTIYSQSRRLIYEDTYISK